MNGWGLGCGMHGFGMLLSWVLGILVVVALVLWFGKLASRGEMSQERHQQMLEDLRR